MALNSGSKKTDILLVDRDPELHKYIHPVLKYEGYNVISAYTGAEALDVFDKCELVMASDRFDDMTGGELVKKLIQKGCGLPILYLVSTSEKGIASMTPAGVNDVMSKPLNGAVLIRKLAELLLPSEDEEDDMAAALQALKMEYIQALLGQVNSIEKALQILKEQPHQQEPFAEAVTLSHRIRGTAGSYGFPEVGLAAGVLEDLLKAMDREHAAPDWAPFMEAFSQMHLAAERIAGNNLAA